MKNYIDRHFEYLSSIDKLTFDTAAEIANLISECFMNGGKLYLCGCGLSSVLADYAALIFASKCNMERPPLPAISLSRDVNTVAGDNLYDIYEKQVNTFLTEHDILMGIVSDSKCENVIRGLRAAAHAGVKTLAMAGQDNASIQGVSDVLLLSPGRDTIHNQEFHIILIHAICDMVDKIMFYPGEHG